MYIPLHEKPYFENLGISWKVQKHQVNVIYSSTFLARRKDRISHHQKAENKNFPVISKYHLSSRFWLNKRPYLTSRKKFKTSTFEQSVNMIFLLTFWLKKDRIFHLQIFKKKSFFVISKHGIPC